MWHCATKLATSTVSGSTRYSPQARDQARKISSVNGISPAAGFHTSWNTSAAKDPHLRATATAVASTSRRSTIQATDARAQPSRRPRLDADDSAGAAKPASISPPGTSVIPADAPGLGAGPADHRGGLAAAPPAAPSGRQTRGEVRP